jgi:hypothetical protein
VIVIGRGVYCGQDYGQQESQPFEQPAEVVPGGGEDGVGCVTVHPGKIVSAHAMLGLGVSDHGLDRGAAAQLAFDCLGDAVSLARDIDLELVVGRGGVAAIAAVGDDAREVGTDLRLDLRDHGGQRVAVIRVAGQRLELCGKVGDGVNQAADLIWDCQEFRVWPERLNLFMPLPG